MTFTFAALFSGALLLHAGVSDRSVQDILRGIYVPGPGAGTKGFLTAILAPGAAAAQGGAGQLASVTAGGGWGGSEGVAKQLARGLGLALGSQKRSTMGTASGGVSDHWTGCKQCYAIDLTGSTAAMDRAAAELGKRLGRPDWKGGSWLSVTQNGYRIQVGWRVADHYDHVHLGVRKAGYAP